MSRDANALHDIGAKLPSGSLTAQVIDRNKQLERALRSALGAARYYQWKMGEMHPDEAMDKLVATVEDVCAPFKLNPSERV